MHDQNAAALGDYLDTLDRFADLQGHINQNLAQASAAERLARALCAEAHTGLEKRRDLVATISRVVAELSPTP